MGLGHYVYAPKDDARHRQLWRELYGEAEQADLREIISQSEAAGVTFVYCIAPGLDMTMSSEEELSLLLAKLAQVASLGCDSFAVLFDDVPQALCPADEARFGSADAAQAFVMNEVEKWAAGECGVGGVLAFCPTVYCSMMAGPGPLASCAYLAGLGASLHPRVRVCWTGPNIISETITRDHILEISAVLRRPPLIWDNLYANDYDQRRCYLGPYSGRDAALLTEGLIAGILINPNNEFEFIAPAVGTLGLFVRSPATYAPEAALARMVKSWAPSFATAASGARAAAPAAVDVELLCHLFYLPFSHGARARELLAAVKAVTTRGRRAGPDAIDAMHASLDQVIALFDALVTIKDRGLLYALYGYVWAAKEEAHMLKGYADWLVKAQAAGAGEYRNGFYIQGTYRGGFVADLQRLTAMGPTSAIAPAVGPAACAVIRPFRVDDAGDTEAFYRVCLETGDGGADGTHLYPDDPLVIGHRYTGPYLRLEPALAFALEDDAGVCGYALAVPDSAAFYEAYARIWIPEMRERYAGKRTDFSALGDARTPAQRLTDELFTKDLLKDCWQARPFLSEYPAHLHIDIVARGQGKGWGTRLMRHLLASLKRTGARGVHLEMAAENHRAFLFYQSLGFKELFRDHEDCVMGLELY